MSIPACYSKRSSSGLWSIRAMQALKTKHKYEANACQLDATSFSHFRFVHLKVGMDAPLQIVLPQTTSVSALSSSKPLPVWMCLFFSGYPCKGDAKGKPRKTENHVIALFLRHRLGRLFLADLFLGFPVYLHRVIAFGSAARQESWISSTQQDRRGG